MFKILLTIWTIWLSTVSCQYFSGNPWYNGFESPGVQGYVGAHHGLEDANFVNEWTVEVNGGKEVAQLVALELGYLYGGEVLGFPGRYIFYKYGHNKERRTPSHHHTASLNNDRRVRWAEQLFSKTRVKRYSNEDPDKVLYRVKRIEDLTSPSNERDIIMPGKKKRIPAEDLFHPSTQRERTKTEHQTGSNYNKLKRVRRIGDVANSSDERIEKREKRAASYGSWFNDELWRDEWYLQDTRTRSDLPRLDLNVLPVYAMGINGSGIRISVLDDGIEHNHTDLKANYDSEISWDCNDRDPDPTPRYDDEKLNSHGTRCAGEIAMVANNRKCGVGVAWGAKVGGIRLLDGQITDRTEGEAIGYAWDKVDIYSASWGPDDNGRTVEGPGRLAAEAFHRGITMGRRGKGVIYVWANGNGGRNHDNCNCDGYASSRFTISIASASQHGLFPWYGEVCSSTLATTYSSGAYKEQEIATTDIQNSCTLRHTGTSAAAPLAAGIIALALSANPNLTWRDVQHLIVWTSEYAPLSNNPGWQRNGVGLRFDVRFGFGLLNAGALVKAAISWRNVPVAFKCEVVPRINENSVSSGSPFKISFDMVKGCLVNYIEHVELIVTLTYTRRGALEITLVSPQGTKVNLLSARPKDSSASGFERWPLTSVGTWGENSQGIWTAIISDETHERNSGQVHQIVLAVHGTQEMPYNMRHGQRNYNNNYETYQEVFDYYNAHADNNVHIDDGRKQNKHYPNIFDQNDLFRVHHRNPYQNNYSQRSTL